MSQPAYLTGHKYDPDKAQAFLERTAAILDAGALAVMLSIGHRTGLLETLSRLPASTSAEIAREAGLSERYVREWLAVLVTGGVITYDAKHRKYQLPAEHAACLVPDTPLGNLAVYAQHVALMGQVQDHIVERFRTGEGMRYQDYPCFHHVMAEDSGQTVVAQLLGQILPLAPGLADRLERGITVLDAGCGRGEALMALARRYPASRFAGYDLCADAVDDARRAAREVGLDNLHFEAYDLSHFDEHERYDLITSFDAIHDQRSPADLIRRLYGALSPEGIYLVQDIGGSAHLENNLDFPNATLLYAISCVHCTPVSLGQGGDGLGTMWGWETAEAMLTDAGFADVQRHVLPHDPMNVWFVCRKR